MKIKNLFLAFAVIGIVTFITTSCEDDEVDIIKKSKVECKIDGVDWNAQTVLYGDSDSTFVVKGINGTDTMRFSFETTYGLIAFASHNSGAKSYSMIIPGIVEKMTNTEKETSGSFSFTLYDNFLMPTDSIVVTEGKFVVIK